MLYFIIQWKMTHFNPTMENDTMESVTMEKDLVPRNWKILNI